MAPVPTIVSFSFVCETATSASSRQLLLGRVHLQLAQKSLEFLGAHMESLLRCRETPCRHVFDEGLERLSHDRMQISILLGEPRGESIGGSHGWVRNQSYSPAGLMIRSVVARI